MGCVGHTGWANDDVLPYFKRAEHNEILRDRFHAAGRRAVRRTRSARSHPQRRRFSAAAIADSGMKPQDMVTAGAHSDAEIEQLIRGRADTIYHPVGAYKMGIDENRKYSLAQHRRHMLGCRMTRSIGKNLTQSSY